MLRQRNLSEDFIKKILEKAAGRISQSMLEGFLSAIESEMQNQYFTRSSESNLLRIILNQFDFTFFVNGCLKYRHHFEILLTISSNSNYLTDILVRNPEYFHWIINPSVLEYKIDKKYFINEIEKSLSAFKSFESKVNALRNFKRKEILRIGLKDIYLKQHLSDTTKQLTDLALSISSKLFELCYAEVLSKHKLNKIKNRYAVFSLGKLGGSELNYSSDIDLIAFYDKNSFLNKKIYFNQLLTEIILLFIETAGSKTGKGFLYRVDFRLRPDGRNSPLCGSFLDYLKYYEMRGEDWERQMLIKANFLCGSKKLYDNFFNYLSKFIYPSIFIVSPIEQIKKLKLSIERRNKSDANIKLASGGIRDIEFSVQALQLLNGGKDNFIKTGNTLIAINLLKEKNILSDNEAEIFTNSYLLYRKVEHFLQLMNDQQTHIIPESGEIAEKLSFFVGCKNLNEFKDKIERSKGNVNSIYQSIFGQITVNKSDENISEINFADEKRAKSNLEYLRTGKNLLEKKQFDSRTIDSFDKIENKLIKYLKTSTQPDIVLENFTRLIRSAKFPHIWYEEFLDDNFFSLTMLICDLSQKTLDIFSEDKYLRDEFLSRDSLIPLSKITTGSLSLKQFLFRGSLQIAASILTPEDFSKIYSDYLSDKISAIIKSFTNDKPWKDNFLVLAMGSFGSNQLSFASDIDLIFIVQNIDNYTSIQTDFQKLLGAIKEKLNGLEIDCRLRPEGKSSQLVWDLDEYKRYFLVRARIWELQAFTKCRLLYGNKKIFNNFLTTFTNIVKTKDSNLIKSEMLEMRKKLMPINESPFNIKKSPGGVYDIDFIYSYLSLINPAKMITKGEQQNHSDDEVLFKLKNNLNFLKTLELRNQNIFNTKLSKLPTEEIKLFKLARAAGFKEVKSFINKLNEVIQSNKKFFHSTFSK